MMIKDIRTLTLNDLRNIAIDFDSEYELVSKICGYDSSKLFYFVRHFSFTEHVLKYQNKSTKVICIPMKNKHTTLENIVEVTKIIRLQVNTQYGIGVDSK